MFRNEERLYPAAADHRNHIRSLQRKYSGRLSCPLYFPCMEDQTSTKASREELKNRSDFFYLPDVALSSPKTGSIKTSQNSKWWSERNLEESAQKVLDKHNQRIRDVTVLKRKSFPNTFLGKSSVSTEDFHEVKHAEVVGKNVIDRYRLRINDLLQDKDKKSSVFPEDAYKIEQAQVVGKNVLNRHKLRISDLMQQECRERESMEKKCRHWLLASNYFETEE